MAATILERIKSLSEAYFEEIKTIREDFHAYPELSFKEFETAKKISAFLTKEGIEHRTGIAGTGIIAQIKGKNPDKQLVALRADMDALPIQEKNQVSYASRHEGIMHACGHDVHSACLMGALKIIHSLKDDFEGTVWGIFQPGEELLPGGAKLMLEAGIFDERKPDVIFAQHVFPELQAGQLGFRPGPYMASTDEIYITVKGKGGHGALPHQNQDPVIAAAQLIIALQQVVSRHAKPNTPSVLSIGKVIANGATNVIPDDVRLEGTFRTMDESWRMRAHHLIRQIAEHTCRALGTEAEVNIEKGYPALENDTESTLIAMQQAQVYLGEKQVFDLDIRMTAEDFAWFAQKYPVCFYRLGTASPDGSNNAGVHNALFDIDAQALKTGMGHMAWQAFTFKK